MLHPLFGIKEASCCVYQSLGLCIRVSNRLLAPRHSQVTERGILRLFVAAESLGQTEVQLVGLGYVGFSQETPVHRGPSISLNSTHFFKCSPYLLSLFEMFLNSARKSPSVGRDREDPDEAEVAPEAPEEDAPTSILGLGVVQVSRLFCLFLLRKSVVFSLNLDFEGSRRHFSASLRMRKLFHLPLVATKNNPKRILSNKAVI